MSDEFASFFRETTDHEPYPYQERLGTRAWSDLVEVPTGLGKTAGIVVSWLWKRLREDPATPLRLVYCLPMRVLVEQTAKNAREWVRAAASPFSDAGIDAPTVHVLMGGDLDVDWVLHPDRHAIIVGTQDMLLSRALMRGYGMSRYQWPIHFALLHNDALWVYDEVQLMGPALPTSAQLEAFRRAMPQGRPSSTVWMSATLDSTWFDTIDLRPHLPGLDVVTIDDADRERAAGRIRAVKRLHRASSGLEQSGSTTEYLDDLAREIAAAHRPGTQTLVIMNRVARAQGLYRRLGTDGDRPLLLLHSRFRPFERKEIEGRLGQVPSEGRIVVATQAVEAGVDISSATLFTELAPWASLVQRFGRCNRSGEIDDGADVYWMDLASDEKIAPPYAGGSFDESREILLALDSAAIPDLPQVKGPAPLHPVLRRKDFLELFDTEPDLSGFDIDVSPYIRDTGAPQVQVFWRDFVGSPGDGVEARREELCSASMGQIGRLLKRLRKAGGHAYWTWDSLGERWEPRRATSRPHPGSVLLFRASSGGYHPGLGFDSAERGPVPVVEVDGAGTAAPDGMGSDPETRVGRFVSLPEHTANVRRSMAVLAAALGLEDELVAALDLAALWHDVGKAHPAFQTALLDYRPDGEPDAGWTETLWAKSSGRGRLRYRIENEHTEERRLFRHELASLAVWLVHGEGDDLVAYLIAAHHGKLRLALRSLPDERPAPDGRRFARGVWEGDVIPPVHLEGLGLPPTTVELDVMELGRGSQGPSWTERTSRLLEERGPLRLAWVEALLRIADQRASAREATGAPEPTAGAGA